MKKAGIAIIVIGLLFTIITGFNFFTKKKVVDIGNIKINATQSHHVKWSPYLGAGIMVVGGIIFFAGSKKLS